MLGLDYSTTVGVKEIGFRVSQERTISLILVETENTEPVSDCGRE